MTQELQPFDPRLVLLWACLIVVAGVLVTLLGTVIHHWHAVDARAHFHHSLSRELVCTLTPVLIVIALVAHAAGIVLSR